MSLMTSEKIKNIFLKNIFYLFTNTVDKNKAFVFVRTSKIVG